MLLFATQESVTAAQPAVRLSTSVTRVSAGTGISDLLLLHCFVFLHSTFDACLFVAADSVLSSYWLQE